VKSIENTNKTIKNYHKETNNKLKNELLNVIKVRFYTENGFFFAIKNSNLGKNFDEEELNKKINFYLEKYDFDNLFIQDSNKILDEILFNLNKHFFSEEKTNKFKISNFGFDKNSKLKKFKAKENFKNLADDLRSFKNTNINNNKYDNNKINQKPAMKYNKYQKGEIHEPKFFEEFDYTKSKLKKNNNDPKENFLDEIKNTKSKIEKELIKNLEKKPKDSSDNDEFLKAMLDNLMKDEN
jgi:hypothetical protein